MDIDKKIMAKENEYMLQLIIDETLKNLKFLDQQLDLGGFLKNKGFDFSKTYQNNADKVDMRDVFKQSCNEYPKIMLKDLQTGRQFEFGKNTHDRLVISEDGRTLSYYNMQNGDGGRYGDYRFDYEKPSVEEYGENIADADFYARMVSNENILNGGEK